MHRAVRLSAADGNKMIEYYGYDGVYKKLMEGNREETKENRG
jgi:hypothetical protein